MRLRACSRESELTSLLGSGHWPDAASPELRAHVAGCRSCTDLALIRQAFAADRAHASAQPRLESSGAIWWRAQLRRRNAVLRRINRPILGAQIFALVVVLVGAAVLLTAYAGDPHSWLAFTQQIPRALHLEVLIPQTSSSSQSNAWLQVPLLAILAVTSGVVAYVVSDKR